jgi:hypothetical protein
VSCRWVYGRLRRYLSDWPAFLALGYNLPRVGDVVISKMVSIPASLREEIPLVLVP